MNYSVRTLAWLGDAEFENRIRHLLAERGDYPVDQFNKIKSKIVCAGGQAQLLSMIQMALDEPEQAIVKRARNSTRVAPRGADTREYRLATALEALVAYWVIMERSNRFKELLEPAIQALINQYWI